MQLVYLCMRQDKQEKRFFRSSLATIIRTKKEQQTAIIIKRKDILVFIRRFIC